MKTADLPCNPSLDMFEIHITGDESIMEVGPQLGMKTIAIDLLKPNKELLRTEYMTSDVKKLSNFALCKSHVFWVVEQFESFGVKIHRVKIECPFYDHYLHSGRYIESHFPTTDIVYPISRNQKKTTISATAREYDQTQFTAFAKKWVDVTVEICLYDSNVEGDKDWFDLWA
jgi:hypothetical protein